MNELTIVEEITEDKFPDVYREGGLLPFIERVRAEVEDEIHDVTTSKGRTRVASLAAKVSKSKVAVEKPGRAYLKVLKAQPKIIEKELREFCSELDLLRDKVREPLTSWEEAEKEKERKFSSFLIGLNSLCDLECEIDGHVKTHAELTDAFDALVSINTEDHPAEHRARIALVKDNGIRALSKAMPAREKYEEDQADLVRLKKEAADKAQAEHEATIAAEAAAKAKAEAEQKAAVEQAKIEADKQAAIEAESKAKRDAEQATLEKIQAEEFAKLQARLAEENRIKAEDKAKQDVVEAAEAARAEEVERQEEQAKAAAEKQAKIEANKKLIGKCRKAAKEALMGLGISEAEAVEVVLAIHRGLIPNVTLTVSE